MPSELSKGHLFPGLNSPAFVGPNNNTGKWKEGHLFLGNIYRFLDHNVRGESFLPLMCLRSIKQVANHRDSHMTTALLSVCQVRFSSHCLTRHQELE